MATKISPRKLYAESGASMHKVRQSNILHSNGYLPCPAFKGLDKRADMERIRKNNPGKKLDTKHSYDFHLERRDETSRQKGLRRALNKLTKAKLREQARSIINEELDE